MESILQEESKGDEVLDFQQLLEMNTSQQKLYSTQTFQQVKYQTEAKKFDEDESTNPATYYFSESRSYMTLDSLYNDLDYSENII